MKIPSKSILTLLGIVILSLVGSLAIYYSTRWGPWAYSDSTEYIVSARNLLAGHGLGIPSASGSFMPLTLHPPLYPLVLSAMGLVGFDLIEAARWLNIFLFGAMIFLSGSFSYALFHSSGLALSLSAVILTLPTLVDVSSGAMSELLFLFITTLGICLLISYLGLRKRSLLILSSIFIGLAVLCRYPGIVVIVTGMIVILVSGQNSWKKRIEDFFEFSLISITPITIWLIWIYSQTRTLSARAYQFNPSLWSDTIELRTQLTEIFWSWLPFQGHLPPYSYTISRNSLIFLFASILILFCLVAYRKISFRNPAHNGSQEFTYSSIWMIFILGNLLLLAATFIFTKPRPDLNPRTLLPVQMGLVFTLLALLSSAINAYHLPQALGWACATLVLIFSLSYARTSWNIVNQYHISGAGYTSKDWHASLTLQQARELPSNIPIITNESAAILLLLDRPAYDFCTLPCSQTDQLPYGDDLLDPNQVIFREDGAALVLFYPYCGVQAQPWYFDTMAQIKSLTQNLTQYYNSCEGAIYFYPSTVHN
jgi:4-amino-4-deoxy-L-arabinose transferase-like glycosyltransferase